jgi:hypothetical protein
LECGNSSPLSAALRPLKAAKGHKAAKTMLRTVPSPHSKVPSFSCHRI